MIFGLLLWYIDYSQDCSYDHMIGTTYLNLVASSSVGTQQLPLPENPSVGSSSAGKGRAREAIPSAWLTIPAFYKPNGGNCQCCEIMFAVTVFCPEDSIPQPSSLLSSSYALSNPLPLGLSGSRLKGMSRFQLSTITCSQQLVQWHVSAFTTTFTAKTNFSDQGWV